MTERTGSVTRDNRLIALVALLAVVAAAGGWFVARTQSGAADKAAVEAIVHDYILENPEILPKAMDNLKAREAAQQLTGVRGEVESPYPGAVMGNPKGSVTLVEFSDYACGYCRKSLDDVRALIEKNPDLRIVMRELPILSPQSADAARMALAAAEQGKYEPFHDAMFAAGRPGKETIEAAARKAGLDMDKARAAIASPRVEAELQRNIELARSLGFGGTPSWIIGDDLISGAVGFDQLSEAIDDARS